MTVIDISRLSTQERLELIGELCDSLEAEDLPLSDELKAELDRRDASFAEDCARAIPWSDVRAKLRRG
ncbi:MAG TPA: addiction module protein [Stellaceae bacterium]|nr:addiction module protein [Stellaceae bacterium]